MEQTYSPYLFSAETGMHVVGLGLDYGETSSDLNYGNINITISGKVTYYSEIALYGSVVRIAEGSFITVPNFWSACWLQKSNFMCPGMMVNSTNANSMNMNTKFYPPPPSVQDVLINGTIYIAATRNVIFDTGSCCKFRLYSFVATR